MLKRLSYRTILRIVNITDWIFRRTGTGREIDAYIGYATPDTIVLRGRVLSKLRHAIPLAQQSKLVNLRQMLGMFLTNEVRGETVRCGDVTAQTDEEGYFSLALPRDGRSGWSTENVCIDGHSELVPVCVFVPADNAQFMVISDIDDTMLQTGAYSLMLNLYTSLTGNSGTRFVFPDAIDLMRTLHEDGRNPVYYVSSSPWNLHDFLAKIFANSNLVMGPMFLRDLGLSKAKLHIKGHGHHKNESIDALLQANPDLPAILLGDTGQHDVQIYRDVIERHKGRIVAVGLRTPGPGLDANDRHDLTTLAATGVPYFAAPNFTGFAQKLSAVCAGRADNDPDPS